MTLGQRLSDLTARLDVFLENQVLPPRRKWIAPLLGIGLFATLFLSAKTPNVPISADDMRAISGCYRRGADLAFVSAHLLELSAGGVTLTEANPKTENQRYPALRTRLYLDYDKAADKVSAKTSADEMYIFFKSDWIGGRYIEALDRRGGSAVLRQSPCPHESSRNAEGA